ncbi:LysR family transcriptional regulator [Corallococcus llansteffanensis]|uniref:LysR family transcriptional regulator n=2 Tax=Corallococcus llansteffanensis TaxID=2316731 RepID=A0A3A8PSY6_9BACT|nr:LysR family transcriptional regulator [Corallococcus llansteffanensis]
MNDIRARALDLNLLRVLVAVADAGSVTKAAARLYLTQSAVSAALGRLSESLDTPMLVRHGRGVILTSRAARLVTEVRPLLEAMLQASFAPARFDPRTSERIIRLGLADYADELLLPPLLRRLGRDAPKMRLICTPVQFRTVVEALATRRVDLAATVIGKLPQAILRTPLIRGHFVCLFDPRHVRLGARPTQRTYLAQEHVIVSFNGDLRGTVEDAFGVERRVRCSVASFSAIGAIVDGSELVATLPEIVAAQLLRQRPHLRSAPFPFEHPAGGLDLLWPAALDEDDACAFVRAAIIDIVKQVPATS